MTVQRSVFRVQGGAGTVKKSRELAYTGHMMSAQEALNFLARQRNFNYRVVLIGPTSFQALLKQYQTLGKEVKSALEELERQLQPGKGKKQRQDVKAFG